MAVTPGWARPAPHLVGGGPSDEAAARRALEEFRAAGLTGDYWLEFDLRVLPHRAEEHTVHGQLIGSRGAQGLVTRIDVAGRRWLIQSGSAPAVWTVEPNGGAVRKLSAAETLQPLAGTDLTPFDLQMPFLYWRDSVYEGVARVLDRPAYSFLLYPPTALAAQRPDLGAVRVDLDTQFRVLVQAEMLDPDGRTRKTITVLDLKKAEGQWVVKSIDLRNPVTRDKTRFTITAVALNLSLAPDLFTPPALANAPLQPPPGRIERF